MSSTRPEGVAIVSNATEPTTRMLMSLQVVSVSRWPLSAAVPERQTTTDQQLYVLANDQFQLLFCCRRNIVALGQNCVRQGRSALTGADLGHSGNRGLDHFRGVLGILDQNRDNLLDRDR